jgi:hypothetical protein
MSKSLAALAVEQEDAQRAYDDGDWARAARLWCAIATTTEGYTASRAFYQAACGHARNGDLENAFALLGEALSMLALPLDELETDPELDALRGDSRWPGLLAHASTVFAAWEASLGNPDLRRELLQLRQDDQEVRHGYDNGTRALEEFSTVDLRTGARLREIVAAHGWPGISLVGHDGAAAAWLIVQHAAHNRPFQEECLAKLREAVRRGEAEARHVAYLEDRLAVTGGRPQRYGTQFSPRLEPEPIEDEQHLDERRRAVGLNSMAAYTQLIRKRYSR